jgi:hypothetical protein
MLGWALPSGSFGYPPQVGPDYFGLNAQYVLDAGAPVGSLNSAVAGMGVRSVRFDINWQGVQASRGASLDFSRYDTYFVNLAQHGLAVYAILDYSANWASSVPSDQHAPPMLVSEFAAFVNAVVARYGVGGTFWSAHPELDSGLAVRRWEVWNEENLNSNWKPVAVAAGYASLFAAAADAIHTRAPGSTVVVGGLAQLPSANTGIAPGDFLSQMLSAQPSVAAKIDAVGLHTYANTKAGILDPVGALRSVMRSSGLAGVPIDLSEWGTSSPMANEATRASLYGEVIDELARTDCIVGFVAPFTAYTAGAGYGLFHAATPPATDIVATQSATTVADRVAYWRGLGSTEPPHDPVVRCG